MDKNIDAALKDKILDYVKSKFNIKCFYFNKFKLMYEMKDIAGYTGYGQVIKTKRNFSIPVFIYYSRKHLLDQFLDISQKGYDLRFYGQFCDNGVLPALTTFEQLAIEADLLRSDA